MQKTKKLIISVTVLVAAVILITGTLAWQQMVNKINEFIGTKNDGIIVHDDFDPDTGKKDVYVENPNEVDLFVRVKLNEAMSLTSNTWRPVTAAHWRTHTYEDIPQDCKKTSHEGKKFHDYFSWTMGGQKYYMPGNQTITQDTHDYNGTEPGVKQTPNAQIIKVVDYLALTQTQREAFIGWIYDTNGYAYWSQPIGKGEVTGLLLHWVTPSASLKGTDYYYAIDVIVEAVDINDIPMWTQGAASVDGSGKTATQASANGKAVIGNIVAISEAKTASADAISANDDFVTELDDDQISEDEQITENENAPENGQTVNEPDESNVNEEETLAENEQPEVGPDVPEEPAP